MFLVPSRWGHPGLGRVSVLFSSTRSERRLSLFVIGIPSGWGHPLGQLCFPFPLDLDRRITLAFGSCSFRLGSWVWCFFLPLVSWGGLHRLPLCSSSLPCGTSFCSVSFLLLASFLALPCWTFRHRFFFWLSFVVVARCVLCSYLSYSCVPLGCFG